MTSDGSYSYTYDPENRLLQARKPAAVRTAEADYRRDSECAMAWRTSLLMRALHQCWPHIEQ